MPDLSPYPWTSLPPVTADVVNATRLGASVFGAGGSTALFSALGEVLEEFGVEELRTGRSAIAAHSGISFSPELGGAVAFTLVQPGRDRFGFIAIDPGLAAGVVDDVIGNDDPGAEPSIDDWSFGVLAFVLARVASRSAAASAPALVVSAERRPAEWLVDQARSPAPILEFAIELGHPRGAGWVRLFVDRGMIETMRGDGQRAIDADALTTAVAEVPVSTMVSIGRVQLSEDEIASLSPGDVLLLSEHAVDLEDVADFDEDAGRLWFGSGFVPASIGRDGDRWNTTIRSLERIEEQEVTMASNTSETTQLMGGSAASVEAVVGRVEMDLAEVARLTPGQVLLVDRQVGDPVEIVVNGMVIARGELVDVEGRLGVRLLSMQSR